MYMGDLYIVSTLPESSFYIYSAEDESYHLLVLFECVKLGMIEMITYEYYLEVG